MALIVEVVKFGTNEIVKTLGPVGEREAERLERGVSINLDRERFYVRIVEAHEGAKEE